MCRIFRTLAMSPATSVPPYSQPACTARAVTTAIVCPPTPPPPPEMGMTPTAKAIGTPIGAVTRSAGRTQSAVRALTGRNSSPYTVSEPLRSRRSRQASTNMVTAAKSPAPMPVNRGLGNLPSAATAGTAGGLAPPAPATW
ncbi:hypothetical protein Sfulv_39320 [Streptomyces fulvorobeus]|uniref:Uncharacterized protein n=1 Tax=Streptomyces fulvorobeus TaxID=284028 RepID=A0A7J0C9G8_9ACTN|nr:hypothetical protein Sfulv_39320 [Streptomyces fulvorobeus]